MTAAMCFIGLLVAEANGLSVPDACWVILAIGAFASAMIALAKD